MTRSLSLVVVLLALGLAPAQAQVVGWAAPMDAGQGGADLQAMPRAMAMAPPPRPPPRPVPWPPVGAGQATLPVPLRHSAGLGRAHEAALLLYLAALRQRLDCRMLPAGRVCPR